MAPSAVQNHFGIVPYRLHQLGKTRATKKEFEQYLLSIRSNFTRELYDLTKWNCNNFTDHVCKYLLHHGIPPYILHLPEEITKTFMGKIIINFIKMFSNAPIIDSEDACHPRQTLALPRGRRNSCPGELQFAL